MSLYYFTKRNSLFGRVCSYVLTFVLVLSMALGCVVLPQRVSTSVKAATTAKYRNVMYYGDWSIYSGQKNFTPDKIDGSLITHLNFAFMDADANGDLITTDTWADYQNPNVGYSVGSDNKYAGVLGAMVLLRQKYPNMKIGISVGGWTRSGDFPKLAASDKTRKNFANNVAKFVHCYGYDFVDIDWEYPTADRDPDPEGNGVAIDKGCKGSAADTQNYTLLLQAIRDALDSYGAKDNKHYELSVAMSASPKMMAAIEYEKVLKIVDFANMMTYDLNGAWGGFTAHQTALYTNPAYDEGDAGLSVDSCIKYLEKKLNVKAHGILSFDLKEDKDGKMKVTEVNIRHMAYTGVMAEAGFDLIEDTIKIIEEGNCDNVVRNQFYHYEKPYVFLRDVDVEPLLLESEEIFDN